MQSESSFVKRSLAACEGPTALKAFAIVSAMESSFFPVPIDMAMVPLGIAQRARMWLVVLVGTLGSVFGALLGYLAGAFFFATIGQWIIELYGLGNQVESFREIFIENGSLAILIAGISPIPFKLAAILSGSMQMSILHFLVLAFLVRLLRFTLMGVTIYFFGPRLKWFIEERFLAFAAVLTLTMAGGFLIIPAILQ